jgi:hypothetical protein
MDGVARKDRTSDLAVRNSLLFRLSYRDMDVASRAGLEPATYRVEAGRSLQLSYLDRKCFGGEIGSSPMPEATHVLRALPVDP